jgi:drug/metabolite transporter (DMT)-like permease
MLLFSWIPATLLSTFLFVIGHVYMKLALLNPFVMNYWFSIAMGGLGLTGLIYTSWTGREKTNYRDVKYALLSGVFIFFGYLTWVYAIQKAPHVLNVYILFSLIAGIVIIGASVYSRYASFQWVNMIGFVFIIAGILLIMHRSE